MQTPGGSSGGLPALQCTASTRPGSHWMRACCPGGRCTPRCPALEQWPQLCPVISSQVAAAVQQCSRSIAARRPWRQLWPQARHSPHSFWRAAVLLPLRLLPPVRPALHLGTHAACGLCAQPAMSGERRGQGGVWGAAASCRPCGCCARTAPSCRGWLRRTPPAARPPQPAHLVAATAAPWRAAQRRQWGCCPPASCPEPPAAARSPPAAHYAPSAAWRKLLCPRWPPPQSRPP